MKTIDVNMSNVDWRLLRKQKLALLEDIHEQSAHGRRKKANHLRGILHLLDDLQDQAAETAGERAIFGNLAK